MLLKLLLGLAGSISLASAQQSAWGQCGGTGWTGATTCVSGYYCVEQNSYYSQCIPGGGSQSTSSPTTLSTEASSTTAKATATSTAPSTPKSTGIKYLISFGDSYSQTGFEPNLTLANAANPIGNPAFPGYTTTNGKNWIGYYITQFNTTPVYSYNFAYGGATTDANLVEPFEPTVLSFVDQIIQYETSLKTIPNFAPWTASNSLFAVWMGVNDVGNGWYESNWTTIIEDVMTQYINQTQTLYNSGARKFLFLTVPPINLTPSVIAEGSSVQAQEATAISQYNNALVAKIAAFKAANAGVTTYVLNTTTPFMTAINDPTAYGAPNATCYDASGTACLWFNDYHPGQAIHKLVATAMASLLGNW